MGMTLSPIFSRSYTPVMEGIHPERGLWKRDLKDCSRNLILPLGTCCKPCKMQDWGNQPCSMTWSCAKKEASHLFHCTLARTEAASWTWWYSLPNFHPPRSGEAAWSVMLHICSGCSTHKTSCFLLPRECWRAGNNLGKGQKQNQELWPLYQALLQRSQMFAWPTSALI